MDTTITIKTNTKLRNEAKKLAGDLGINLTSVVNAFLRQFVRERKFSVSAEPMPTKEKIALLQKISEEMDRGEFEGPFEDVDSFLKTLNA